MTAILNARLSWEWSFWIQLVLSIPAVSGIFLIPSKYFEIHEAITYRAECKQKLQLEPMSQYTVVKAAGSELAKNEDFIQKNTDLQQYLENQS